MINKYNGCLLGLAIGDALGAPVESLSLSEIRRKYGEEGITDFDAWDRFRAGSYSEDTQMSLVSAIGCIKAYQSIMYNREDSSTDIIYRGYLEWLNAQKNPFWLRYTGNTIQSALESGRMGTIENPINNSKDCNGLMRTAAVGLAFPSDMAFREGAEYAAITHGHPSAYLPAGFLSKMIAHLIEGSTLREAVEMSKKKLVTYDNHEETLRGIESAIEFSLSREPIEKAIQAIGEERTGGEALGVAVYCSLKFFYNFKEGVQAAVNHSGDSDSTGTIAGAILGASLGIEAIPENWIRNLEDVDTITQIANDIFKVFKMRETLSIKKYPLS
jgi:ADP-ribosylglycohydrolase